MPVGDVIRAHLARSFALYDELVAALPEDALAIDIPATPSNRLGEQLWCVIGARESYARAIDTGAWAGFSCSLTRRDTRDKRAVAYALETSAVAVLAVLTNADGDDARSGLVMDLLEHEAAHHGQLIRYLYARKLAFPAGWKARYALEEVR